MSDKCSYCHTLSGEAREQCLASCVLPPRNNNNNNNNRENNNQNRENKSCSKSLCKL